MAFSIAVLPSDCPFRTELSTSCDAGCVQHSLAHVRMAKICVHVTSGRARTGAPETLLLTETKVNQAEARARCEAVSCTEYPVGSMTSATVQNGAGSFRCFRSRLLTDIVDAIWDLDVPDSDLQGRSPSSARPAPL